MKKYDRHYAELYAALWAYGYETLHLGGTEGLYRTALAMGLANLGGNEPVILDFGCGVGRLVRDFARLVPTAQVHGCDTSRAMIQVAKALLCNGRSRVRLDLSSRGFGVVTLPACSLPNVRVWRIASFDDHRLRALNGRCDLVISVNVLDRVANPHDYLRAVGTLIAQSGSLVLSVSRNWQQSEHWRRLNNIRDLITCVEAACQVHVTEYFVGLPYAESLDRNRSLEFYEIVALCGTRKGQNDRR